MGEERIDKIGNEDLPQTDDNAVNKEQSNKKGERVPGEEPDKRTGRPGDHDEHPGEEKNKRD